MTIGAISYESLIYFYSRIFGEKLLESELDFFLWGGGQLFLALEYKQVSLLKIQ